MPKQIYTGLYLFGEINGKTAFGGVSCRIKLPDYKKEIMLYLNDKAKNLFEKIDNATVYDFNINELEGIYSALGRIINDIRKLETLSKNDLLKDEIYSTLE
ncbi:hypothetical protein [uncultured Gilliamella sp.]|jgi:hypothetical protein|uniref:hypothetical protein n=1 Tax=uncultured Gilliamella sp. TaxID=1193505 RepID=UPI0025DCAFEA|nr:hypothetical protein [uncultured Gilliamella sp.]